MISRRRLFALSAAVPVATVASALGVRGYASGGVVSAIPAPGIRYGESVGIHVHGSIDGGALTEIREAMAEQTRQMHRIMIARNR